MAPITYDGSVPNQRVAGPLRVMNRRMISEALIKISITGEETLSIAGKAEKIEIEIYEVTSSETEYLERVSDYIRRMTDSVLTHGDFQPPQPQPPAEPSAVASSSSFAQQEPLPPQPQPPAEPSAVASSSSFAQQEPLPPQSQPPAGPPAVTNSSGFSQQEPLVGSPTISSTPQQQPQQEEPGFETTHISEHNLKRFQDLRDWQAGRENNNGL